MILPLFLVLFVGLKLASIIAWGWGLVLIPLWIIIVRFLMQTTFKFGVENRMQWALSLRSWMNS